MARRCCALMRRYWARSAPWRPPDRRSPPPPPWGDAYPNSGPLCQWARARMAGARKVVLETNSRLAAALHVYRKLGFKAAPTRAGSTYARTDTALELEL